MAKTKWGFSSWSAVSASGLTPKHQNTNAVAALNSSQQHIFSAKKPADEGISINFAFIPGYSFNLVVNPQY